MRNLFGKFIKFLMPLIRFLCRQPDYQMQNWEKHFFYGRSHHGRVILTKTDWCCSNLGIRGFWKHAGIIENNTHVLEAKTKEGFVRTPIKDFLKNKDHYVVLEMFFASKKMNNKIVETAKTFLGKSYDTSFKDGEDEVYCSEAVYYSFSKNVPWFGFYYGKIIEPIELYKSEHFKIVKEVHRR